MTASCVLLLVAAVAAAASAYRLKDVAIVWADEFDGAAGSTPDPSKWGFHIGDGTGHGLPGWGNQELEYYTDKNAVMDGAGNLVIEARSSDAASYACYYGACQYTSGRIFTGCKFTHRYGRFEARLKTPTGQGCWPAFWMLGDNYDNLGWPDSGEVDIMELKGSNPNVVMGTIHGPGYSGNEGITDSYSLPGGASFADAFHVFAIEWEQDTITWYVDDVAYRTRTPADLDGKTWVFDHPFYFLFNFAVGGQFDGNPGPDTIFPQQYTIDYVRVYDQPGNSTTLTPPITRSTVPYTGTTPSKGPTTPTPPPPSTTTRAGGVRDAYSNIEAETADEQTGTTKETCSDVGGGQDVAGIGDGDSMVFRNVDFGATGPATVELRYASGIGNGGTGTISLILDSPTAQYFSLMGIGFSGGWQTWLSETGSISPPPTGVHDVYVTFQSSAGEDFASVNWLVFHK